MAKKKKEQVVLNEAIRKAFHQLKKAVMSAPVLAYPDPNREYLLQMDALRLALGAVLSQNSLMGNSIQWHLEVELYMEWRQTTTVPS